MRVVEFFECLLFDNVEWYFLLIKKQISTVSVIRLIEKRRYKAGGWQGLQAK